MDKKQLRIAELTKDLNKTKGVTESDLKKLLQELGIALPDDYLDFMRITNGAEGPIGESGYVSIWPIEEIKSGNEEYGVNEDAPGLVVFGTDGGDAAYAFDTRKQPIRIVNTSLMTLSLDELRDCGINFLEFLECLAKQ